METKTFEVDNIGRFVLRRPTIGDEMSRSGTVLKYLGTAPDLVDEDTAVLTRMVVELEQVTVSKPQGFNSFKELNDVEPVISLYKKYSEWRDTFFKGMESQSTEAGDTKEVERGGSGSTVVSIPRESEGTA